MKVSALCPISDKKIDENVARINATFTVLLLAIFGFTGNIFPVLLLSIDFLLRSSTYSKYSLIGLSSRNVVRYLSITGANINAGPKIFAARIGFVLSTLIVLTSLLNLQLISLTITGILGLFSFLEAAFGLCVACEIYPFVYKFLNKE